MPIKSRLFPILSSLLSISILSLPEAIAANDDDPVQNAACMLVFGIEKDSCNIRNSAEGTTSFADWIARYKAAMVQDSEMQNDIFERAMSDAFGTLDLSVLKKESSKKGNNPDSVPLSYIERMDQFLDIIANHSEVYEAVIDRAYKWTIYRAPYAEEIKYWKQQGPTNFIIIVGALEHWARRNQPGLMVTGGEPTLWYRCEFLETQPLSVDFAQEIVDQMHPAYDTFATVEKPLTILSPHAPSLKSSGSIPFIPIGSDELRNAGK